MIRSVLKFIFRTLYGIFAFIGFGIIFLVFILSAGLTYLGVGPFSSLPLPLNKDSILTLNLNSSYVEHADSDGLQALLMGKDASLYDMVVAIRKAGRDPKVKGLVARIEQPALGTAQIQELRDAVLEFRKSGKPSWCYSDSFGELSQGTGLYYIASAFEQIWLQPLGSVNLTGVKIEIPFGKEALEKLDVKAEVIQKKEYKSYTDMFTRDDFSEHSKESYQAVIDSILSQVVDGIAKDRKMPHDQVRSLIANGPYFTEEALALKLIDRIDYRQNLITAIHEKLGEDIKFLPVSSYFNTLIRWIHGSKVALIFGSGIIFRDESGLLLGGTGLSSDDIYKAFQLAGKDPDVKAIVFRINSEGGSPSASESIYSIINYAKEHWKKPVIISMSDAAASGGYWISLAGTKIVAQPATLTGSIGVFGGKFVLKGLFEKLGIKWGEVSTSENAMMWSLNESYTPAQWVKLNAYMDQIYDGFTSRVAKSRKLSPEQVEKVARGRVWTGEQALALGLVDQLGGIQTAIDLAIKEAGLEKDADVGVQVYPRHRSILEKFAVSLDSAEDGTSFQIGIFGNIMSSIKRISDVLGSLVPQQDAVYHPLGKVK